MRAADIDRIVEKNGKSRGSLIGILQDIQARYNYLPVEALKEVAAKTGRSLVDIYGVATFYKMFSLTPRGKHLASVCLGTACHVRGGPAVVEEFERQLHCKAGSTTEDQEFTLETVNCLGACALGPIVVVDGRYFSNVNTAKVKGILKKARAGVEGGDGKSDFRLFPIKIHCPRCNHSLLDHQNQIDGHPSVKVTASCGRHHGWLRLSSLYGSFSVQSEHDIPVEEIAHVFCPHCHAELAGGGVCSECEAPMVPMIVGGGGMIQICSRRGCQSHRLDVSGVNS